MSNLLPARTKYRKDQKGRIKGVAKGCDYLAFGDFGIQSLKATFVTASQLEAARVAITRHLKRKGKVWMRVFPHKPLTKKPAETRMGKGKGGVEQWVAIVKAGTIMFEASGVTMEQAREAMRLADGKLSQRCRFIWRRDLES